MRHERVESDFSFAPGEVRDEWNSLYNEIEAQYTAEDWNHITPEFLDTLSGEVNLDEVFAATESKRQVHMAEKLSSREANVVIPGNLPITVFAMGDLHLFSVYSNEAEWHRMRDEIVASDGSYIILLHNLIDNANPSRFPNNMIHNSVHPSVQIAAIRKELKMLNDKGKILAAIDPTGCHEGWLYRNMGINAGVALYGFEGRKFPMIENGGVLHLTVGQQEYHIGLWHQQGPFNSNFNKEHGLRQNRRLGGRQTDVELGGHYHVSVATNEWVGYGSEEQKPVGYIQAGTFKGYWPEGNGPHDKFVSDRRGKTGEPPGNSFYCMPFQKELRTTLGFETGMRLHEAFRIAMWLEMVGKKDDIISIINKDAQHHEETRKRRKYAATRNKRKTG